MARSSRHARNRLTLSRRAIFVTLAGVFALVNGVLFYRLRTATPQERPLPRLKFEGGGDPIKARIDAMVAPLKTEGLKESLAAVARSEYYVWPGSIETQVAIYRLPFDASIGQNCIEEILSNRRIRKILEELKGLSKKEQSRAVTLALRQNLKTYEARFVELHQEFAPRFATGSSRPARGFAIKISDNADGSPTIYGSRLAVLGLLLIAANLELHDCKPVVKEIVEKALRQRDTLLGANELTMAYRQSMVRRASLYNRQILATALIATAAHGGIGKNPCEAVRAQWKIVRLTRFDAPATEYDLNYKLGVIRISEKDRVIGVSYLSSLTDDQFERIVECFKE